MRRLACLLLLCGCATVPVARTEADGMAKAFTAAPDLARIYVYRSSSVWNAIRLVTIELDGAVQAHLARETFAVLTVHPGEHQVRAWVQPEAAPAPLKVVVEAGRIAYLQTGPAGNPLTPAAAFLEPVEDVRAAQEAIRGGALVANPVAQSLREAAGVLAAASYVPASAERLLLAAGRALAGLDPSAAAPGDLDEALARSRAARPDAKDAELIQLGATAMALDLHPQSPTAGLAGARPVVDPTCGLVLRRSGSEVVVAGVLPDSTAASAGVRPGSELEEVSGLPTTGRLPQEIVRLLLGLPGSEVAVRLVPPGEASRQIVLRRGPGGSAPVDCRVVAGRAIVLRPWRLDTDSARRLRDLARAAGSAAGQVVLDLRGTTDGTLEGAAALADAFLAAGPLFTASSRDPAATPPPYQAAPEGTLLEQARLVVLVDGSTAGTAEAVAAALQDQRRAAVLGTLTAGVGTVDRPYRVRGAPWPVPVPAARLVRSGGQAIDRVGVTPDVVFDPAVPPPPPLGEEAACPGVLSVTRVSDDPLVRRAIDRLQAPAAGR